MKDGKRNWKLQIAIVIALTLLATLTAPPVEATNHRMRVQVEESFKINGILHSPNIVTVRESRYAPNSVFAEVCVGVECVGRFIAYDNGQQELSDVDSLVFDRNPSGHLVLVGLSFRGEPTRMLAGFMSWDASGLTEAESSDDPGAPVLASRAR